MFARFLPDRRPLGVVAALVAVVVAAWSPAAVAQPSQMNQGQAEGGGEAYLKGANLGVDVWASSGVNTEPGAYLSELYLVFMPSYDLGGRHFKNTWAERLRLSGRLFVQGEITGNSMGSRGPSFLAPAIIPADTGPAGGQSTTGGQLPDWSDRGGLERQLDTSDLWLSAFHDQVTKVPGLDAALEAGVRIVLPVSSWSRNVGMLVAPSLYLGLSRSFADVDIAGLKVSSIDLSLGSRLTGYAYRSRTYGPVGNNEPVEINGRLVTPWRPAVTGDLLPEWMLATTFNLGLSLPADLYFSLGYSLFNQWDAGPTQCTVEGVPTADVCRDGALVGPIEPSYRNDFGYFLADITWSAWSWGSVGLGVSTWASIWRPDRQLGNPFWRNDRNNATTIYLSFSVTAEAVAEAAFKKK